MKPHLFAWNSLRRQPARSLLAVIGIAIVGALLFDMLLLSGGLALSFRQMLDDAGFDVRVSADAWLPTRGAPISGAASALGRLRAIPEVGQATLVRFGRAEVVRGDGSSFNVDFMGVEGPGRGTWAVVEGEDLPGAADPDNPRILVNRALARRIDVEVGGYLRVRGRCEREMRALPVTLFTVAGIVEFQFEGRDDPSTVIRLGDFLKSCQPRDRDLATMFGVVSNPDHGPDAAVAAIRRALPELHAHTNRDIVDRMQTRDFSYFRQISFALSTITLFFAFLLIATLLTVSVNQRLGDVATMRALGFRRARIVADLLWESGLLVGAGGLLALPLAWLLSRRLDAILRQMPGIPVKLEFFVYQPEVLVKYGALLAAAGLLAAAYPVWLAARLPISATLRREVVS